jgi:hypothetical protein
MEYFPFYFHFLKPFSIRHCLFWVKVWWNGSGLSMDIWIEKQRLAMWRLEGGRNEFLTFLPGLQVFME